MDWITGIQNALNYIEDHLKEELDYEEIAKESFSSSFHFQRVFSILCGYTLGEYIRNFREHRAIPLRVKIISVTMVWLTIGFCIFCVVDEYWWAQLLMFVLATAVSWHILSYKTLKK